VLELESALSVDNRGQLELFQPDLLLKELHYALRDRKDVYTASREVLATIIQRLLKQPQKPIFKPTDISKTTAAVLKLFDRSAYLRYLAEHPSVQ
jgi:transcriptional regulator NrdR family protein